jgi:hypothetical protein
MGETKLLQVVRDGRDHIPTCRRDGRDQFPTESRDAREQIATGSREGENTFPLVVGMDETTCLKVAVDGRVTKF